MPVAAVTEPPAAAGRARLHPAGLCARPRRAAPVAPAPVAAAEPPAPPAFVRPPPPAGAVPADAPAPTQKS